MKARVIPTREMILFAVKSEVFAHLSDKEGKKFPRYQKLSVKSDMPGQRIGFPCSQLSKRLDSLIVSRVGHFSFLYTRKMFQILFERLFCMLKKKTGQKVGFF